MKTRDPLRARLCHDAREIRRHTEGVQCTKEKLFIVGHRDQFCSLLKLEQALASVADRKRLHVVGGAGHFFSRHEEGVAEAVRTFAG